MIWDLAKEYYEERGLPWTEWPETVNGDKFVEEAAELKAELDIWNSEYGQEENLDAIRYEIGDVANTLAWIAKCHGTTIEECMVLKTIKDRGRGLGKNYNGKP